jgi:hypothetical protein
MAPWDIDWACSVPLIVLTVVTQVLGLGVISEWIVGRVSHEVKPRHLTALFVVLMAAAALMVTVLLAFQGALWTAAYGSSERCPTTARLCSTRSARSLPTATRDIC